VNERTVSAEPAPVSGIDQAEALMHELDEVLANLDATGSIDAWIELQRLTAIAVAKDSRARATELPRNTGADRFSLTRDDDAA